MNFPPPSPKQARVLWLSLTATAIAILLVLLGALVWAMGWLADRLSAVLLPVAMALIIAYILDPVVEFFVRKRIPRMLSIVLVFLLGLLCVAGLLGSVVPGMVRESRKLIADLPATTKNLQSRAQTLLDNPRLARLVPASWHLSSLKLISTNTTGTQPATTNLADASSTTTTITNAPNDVTVAGTNGVENPALATTPKKPIDDPGSDIIMKALGKTAAWVPAQLGKVSSWVESSIGFFLVPICLFYFLLEKKGINRGWADYLPIKESKAKEEIVFILQSINECMIVFFRGQVLVALCVGTLLTIAYLILGLNYAVLLGVIAGFLGIVPYLGTIVSLVLALTVAAVQFGDWTHPLCVIGIAAVVKMLEDLVISPKIIGDRSGLHPLTIILAVMIGANLLGGFLGALLAIPLTAALRTLMFRYIWKPQPAKAVIAEPKQIAKTVS
ncbi:MAG: hypothetical protein JWR26_4494 [Pedosphaera sp.]|nr:hypothetical protein [Pedosphaera sp.]